MSTGDSLDMSPQDETCILANDATIVDMEVHPVILTISGLFASVTFFLQPDMHVDFY